VEIVVNGKIENVRCLALDDIEKANKYIKFMEFKKEVSQ